MPHQDGCVLIGSGPSLAAVDMRLLADVPTVAFNQSYVAWRQWGFAPTYYCSFDPLGVEDHAGDLSAALSAHPGTRAFLHSAAGDCGFVPSDRVHFVNVIDEPVFTASLETVGDFGNVGASSLQVLAALGYRRVVMVGVDGRYTPGNTVEELRRNYFADAYVTPGRWHSPDPETSRQQWERVAVGVRAAGVDVVNASPASAVECFPKSDVSSALAWARGLERVLPNEH